MGMLERLRTAALRTFFLLANWRIYSGYGRLAHPGANRGMRGDREVIDAFHRLFYGGLFVDGGWRSARWLGVEALKCPFDLWQYQEILWEVRPDLVIETGTAFGGSAAFLASILDLLGGGEVMTIDIKADSRRPAHPRITYLQGSSTSPAILEQVRRRAGQAKRVMVILDSDHRRAHVQQELRLYAPLVTQGSFLIVEDTNVNGHPVFPDHGPGPMEAVKEFLKADSGFAVDRGRERFLISFNPGGYLRRI